MPLGKGSSPFKGKVNTLNYLINYDNVNLIRYSDDNILIFFNNSHLDDNMIYIQKESLINDNEFTNIKNQIRSAIGNLDCF